MKNAFSLKKIRRYSFFYPKNESNHERMFFYSGNVIYVTRKGTK